MASYFASHPYQKIAAESLQYALPTPAEPGWTEGIGTIATAIQEVLLQNKPIKQVLTQEQQAAQTYVSQGG